MRLSRGSAFRWLISYPVAGTDAPNGTRSTVDEFTDSNSIGEDAVNRIYLSLGTATLMAISIGMAGAKDKPSEAFLKLSRATMQKLVWGT